MSTVKSSQEAVTVGSLLIARDTDRRRRERLSEKILECVKLGPRRSRAVGSASWWEVRQLLGGGVRTEEFRSVVDGLIEAGRIVEVWCDSGNCRSVSHRLVLVHHRGAVRAPILQARGRRDRIDDEYADIRQAEDS